MKLLARFDGERFGVIEPEGRAVLIGRADCLETALQMLAPYAGNFTALYGDDWSVRWVDDRFDLEFEQAAGVTMARLKAETATKAMHAAVALDIATGQLQKSQFVKKYLVEGKLGEVRGLGVIALQEIVAYHDAKVMQELSGVAAHVREGVVLMQDWMELLGGEKDSSWDQVLQRLEGLG